MKTLIVGLGNVGTIHGWALSQAGADITHVVQKEKKGQFESGVKMDILDLRGGSPKNYQTVYMPNVAEEANPNDGYELIILKFFYNKIKRLASESYLSQMALER